MLKRSLLLLASLALTMEGSQGIAGGVIGDIVKHATGGVVNLDKGGAVINPPDPKIILNPIPDKVPGTDISIPKVPVLVPTEIQKPVAAILPFVAPGVEAVTLQDAGKRAEQFLDATADVITFGEHGRARDKERAHRDEELADARRKGAEDTKEATLKGLQSELDFTNQSIAKWQRFDDKLPVILEYQKKLVAFATDVIAHNIDVQGTLKSMGDGLRESKGALAVLVDALHAVPQSNDSFADAQAWDFAVNTLASQMKNTNEGIQHFLNRAILQSDPKTLGDFIDVVSRSRNRVEQLTDEAKQNLAIELAHKALVEKQIVALR